MKRNSVRFRRSQQSGAVSVEAAIGAVVFLLFCGFVFDFGMLVHRHALLVDTTIRTVQQVSRDPEASTSVAVLQELLDNRFRQNASILGASSASGMHLTSAELTNCEFREIVIKSEWQTTCALCLFSKFRTTLKAQGIGKLEVPSDSLECQKTV